MKIIKTTDTQFPYEIHGISGNKPQQFTDKALKELYKKIEEVLGKENINNEIKPSMNTYFLSYNYTTINGLNGFGNIEYECDALINSLDDINQITQHMIDNGIGIGSEIKIKGIAILNYILLPK